MWSHAVLVADILSIRLLVWLLGLLFAETVNDAGGILDSDLFFHDRYTRLAAYHHSKGRVATSHRFAVLAGAYRRPTPDDDDPLPAAAMAMPVPRCWITTNAVATRQSTGTTRGAPSDAVLLPSSCPPGMASVGRSE